ncbi:MAG: DNA methyltransferase [Jatrophihabitans sp.]
MSTPVPRSGEEIQAALRGFVTKWREYQGGEREEAQTYLNELIACYGIERRVSGMTFEHYIPTAGFVDLFWPGQVIVEMKAPGKSERLEDAQAQADRYWRNSDDPNGTYDAVRYVVLCSFHRLLIWDMRRPSRPAANLTLDELPDRYEALLFLTGEAAEASFVEHHRELTRDAAKAMAELYQSLRERGAAAPDEIQRFTMQSVWTMFAEDLGMLAGYPMQTIVARLRRESEPNVARDLGFLFRVLNQKSTQNRKGELAGTQYLNGELFEQPAEVDLTADELAMLARATEFDWRRVDPTIFGSLMEGVLGRERRWELGAHYTHEADITKIVGPTIVRPWRDRIDAASSPQQARDLLDELCAFRVLDPACGCGNFLYVAYRELRSLEADLKRRIRSLAAEQGIPQPPGPWPFVPLTNMQGIDIERIAVLIARVTLWMGHRQMIEKFGEAEAPLPLVALPGIRVGDALRIDWPETDCIIGNPPFQGSQHIRKALGDEYVEWLKNAFGVGVKDFCVYWFRKAHAHLRPGQRAGLVGTNSISQNRARSASLQYIVDTSGTITDAVSSQKWPGDAKVHVSLVDWIKGDYDGPRILDGIEVAAIDASLRVAGNWDPKVLAANRSRCFQGPIPVGGGFILTDSVAEHLLALPGCEV